MLFRSGFASLCHAELVSASPLIFSSKILFFRRKVSKRIALMMVLLKSESVSDFLTQNNHRRIVRKMAESKRVVEAGFA